MKRGNELNRILDTNLTYAVEKGILQLDLEDIPSNGRTVMVRGDEVRNFSSCSYLGLETHPNIIKGVVEAVEKYGSQFSSSRAYASTYLYTKLEEKFRKIFEAPVIVTPNTTLGHLAAIPVLVEDEDAVLLDHQIHNSVNLALNRVRLNGTPIHLIRHNRLDQLEKKIQELRGKHKKIWYFIDGVYSMYGDLAPIPEILELMKLYPQLYVYADDAHELDRQIWERVRFKKSNNS